MNKPVLELLKWGQDCLRTVDARLESELLLSFVCEVSRFGLLKVDDVSYCHVDWYRKLIIRRSFGEPIAYLTGVKPFYNFEFSVNPSTLIPRFDTESLFELVASYVKNTPCVESILDVGTGTGALLISLVDYFKDRGILGAGLDISDEVLTLAQDNTKRLLAPELQSQISWHKSPNNLKTYDVVVSNPPYVSFSDWILTPKDVHVYEPERALIQELTLEEWLTMFEQWVKPGGRLFLEWGHSVQESTVGCFRVVDLVECGTKCYFLVLER